MKPSLFHTIRFGSHILHNRIVMPPLTRSRSTQPGNIANAMMAKYYAQRADAGLIISEGTQISPTAQGYAWTPGIYSKEQIAGWKLVTDAVHQEGGIIFAQLWHVGRVTHPDTIGGQQPISASAIKANNVSVFVDSHGEISFKEVVTPREMSHKDIQQVIQDFRQAALNAIESGFDGIELHAANGYLINQFIDSESNKRTDEYGGNTENRLRFLKEVTSAVIDAIGAERVGVRFAPLTSLNGTIDENPLETYTTAAKLLDELGVIYMHIAEVDWEDAPETPIAFKQALRNAYHGIIILAGRYTSESAQQTLEAGLADMIAFGRAFISNPDLVNRLRNNYPLAPHDPITLFGGDENGYTDYPTYQK